MRKERSPASRHRNIEQYYLRRGKSFFKKKAYKKAARAFGNVLTLNPGNGEASFELGKLAFTAGDITDAIRALQKALSSGFAGKHVLLLLAKACLRRHDYERSLEAYLRAIKKGAETAELNADLGLIYKKTGKLELAAVHYKKAVLLEPENAYLREELGRFALYEKKDYDLALGELTKALRLKMKPETCRDLGRVHFHKGNYRDSLVWFRKFLNRKPTDGEGHAELGRVYENMSEYRKAASEYKKASSRGYDIIKVTNPLNWISANLALDSRNIQPGLDKKKRNKYLLEIRNIERERRTLPNCLKLGELYRALGEYPSAIKEFGRAREINKKPNDPFLQNRILNELEICQKKTFLRSRPQKLQISLTSRCKLSCKMCEAWKKPWDLSQHTVSEIMGLFPYLSDVVWSPSAGEVFLSGFFPELFKAACSYPDIHQQIITNGQFLNEEWTDRLTRKNVLITFSIDGVTRRTYEDIRRGADFQKLIKNAERFNKKKKLRNKAVSPCDRIHSSMNFVVMKSNYRELEYVTDFALKLGFDSLYLTAVEGCRDEDIFNGRDDTQIRHINFMISGLREKARKSGLTLHSWLPSSPVAEICGIEETETQKRRSPVQLNPCYLPWRSLSIGPQKNVKPDCSCKHDIGNAEKSSLMDLWNSGMMQSCRKDLLEGRFDRCNYKCVLGINS